MPYKEFVEWIAFYRLEPFGEVREDLRNGTLASLYINSHSKKGSRKVSPNDFILKNKFERAKEKENNLAAFLESKVRNGKKTDSR